MGKNYEKKPLRLEEQIALLRSRGLRVDNEARAISYLQEISYYRLSAYFLPYQVVKDKFEESVTFEQIAKTYSFDRELRLLIFDCIERIEVAIRTQIIYQMAHRYGDSHWQDNDLIFKPPFLDKFGNTISPFDDLQNNINKAINLKTKETFIEHYINTYSNPVNPPSWMCLELLTIGELSRLYKGIRKHEDQKLISNFFDVHPEVFISWLHTITYVRNICAHHSRLWNRDLAVSPKLLLKPKGDWISKPFENTKRVFYFLCVLRYLMQRANPRNSMGDKLNALLEKYPTIPIGFLGIPSDGKGKLLDWNNEPLWKGRT